LSCSEPRALRKKHFLHSARLFKGEDPHRSRRVSALLVLQKDEERNLFRSGGGDLCLPQGGRGLINHGMRHQKGGNLDRGEGVLSWSWIIFWKEPRSPDLRETFFCVGEPSSDGRGGEKKKRKKETAARSVMAVPEGFLPSNVWEKKEKRQELRYLLGES